MTHGTVKFYDHLSGLGLISADTGSREVVVHVSALERAGIEKLSYGQRVAFEVELDRHGRAAARNLCLIPDDANQFAPLPYRRAGAR